MRRGVEGQQGGDAPLQGVGALEARQSVDLFLFNPVSVLRQPVGWIEEDRLGADISRGPAMLQQDKPRLEAAPCVGGRRRPVNYAPADTSRREEWPCNRRLASRHQDSSRSPISPCFFRMCT